MNIHIMKREYRGLEIEQLNKILESEILLAENQCDAKAIRERLSGLFCGEDNFTDALGDIDNLTTGSLAMYNTYPFGQKTRDIYPLLITVCSENQQLAKILQYMVTHGRMYPKRVKTMILFTVKWDLKVFKRFEHDLLRLSLDYGIDIMFILVTDYGFTEIPFREFCYRVRQSHTKIDWTEDDFEYEEHSEEYIKHPIVRYYRNHGTGRANDPADFLYIDLAMRKYYWGQYIPFTKFDESEMIDLPPDKVRRFIKNTQFIKNWKKNYDDTYIIDCGSWSLFIHGEEHKGQSMETEDFNRFLDAVKELTGLIL